MQRKATNFQVAYFQAIAGRGYFFAIILAVLFYCVALLSNKGRVPIDAAVAVIVSYWIGSVAYFIFGMCRQFPRSYRFWLGRMRQYSRFTWILLFYIVGTLFCSTPAIYLFSFGFYEAISTCIRSYSIKVLIASYGGSLFYSMIVMAMIVNVVAAKRGVRRFKAGVKS
jgi:hypothetical protein